MGRIRCVQAPGELTPGPPNQPEHQDRLRYGYPVDSIVKKLNYLRDGEYKYEIEE
jgi:hypothetical protein